jgi:hypothetical protein
MTALVILREKTAAALAADPVLAQMNRTAPPPAPSPAPVSLMPSLGTTPAQHFVQSADALAGLPRQAWTSLVHGSPETQATMAFNSRIRAGLSGAGPAVRTPSIAEQNQATMASNARIRAGQGF